MTVLNTGWTNRYQGPFDQSGRPMQQQFNPTGYVPHGFFGGGRAGLNRMQNYGNALGGQPVYRGNPANQTSTGLPPNYGTQNTMQNTGKRPMEEVSLAEKVQTGGGYPALETGGGYPAQTTNADPAANGGGYAEDIDRRAQNSNQGNGVGTDRYKGDDDSEIVYEANPNGMYTDPNSPYYSGVDPANSNQGNDGGYDGSGINPNGMYNDPMTDPNFDPMANMELPQSGTVAQNAAASQEQESALAQLEDIPGDTPATGLTGYEQAMGQGFDAGMEGYLGGKQDAIQMLLNAYRGSVNPVTGERVMGSRDFDIQETNRAADAMRGYSQGGAEAQQLQAALTGALGPDAQAQAIANFQESPGQKYLREQTERGVLRNAASVGGLGGGNVLKALQANAAGLASQDFQNQFNRLSNVADRGMTASGTMADLFSNLGSRQAQMRNQMGTNIAGVAERYGQRAGDLGFNTGTLLGANRQRVGDRIADNIAATSGAVAGQQGGDLLATLLGGDASSLVNLITAAQSGDAASNQALAELLANLSVGAGSNMTGALRLQPITNTAAEGLKAFGSFMGGGGTAAQAAGAPV